MTKLDKYVFRPEWRVMNRKADFNAIGESLGISPVLVRIMINRGVKKEDMENFIRGDMSTLHDPLYMADLPDGCYIMHGKIRDKKRVRIISDYDVDGVSSAYILLLGLKKVWAALHNGSLDAKIDVDIPDRARDGYGINTRLIDAAHEAGVDTIITCDNGIAAYEPVKYAKSLGMTVIVTDHHQVPYTEENGERTYILPPADAVIDPQRVDCRYPYKGICGAGVAYKFIEQLYKMCGIPAGALSEFTEILGLATNCDMMDLVDENRVFVRECLSTIAKSSNPGLNALMRLAGRSEKRVSTFDLGFLIGPCINAAGRLGSAKVSLDFLLERDTKTAEERAKDLFETNNERKAMTDEGTERVKEALIDSTINGCSDMASFADKVLVAYVPGIHESVVGIIASRLKEAYSRPVLMFTDSSDPDILKGSGRSIEAYNMFEELNKHRDMFTAFGGHAMAAGFSIKRENLEPLRAVLNESCPLTPSDITPRIMIDVVMPLHYNTVALTDELALLEPYGKGNRRPLFAARSVPVLKAQILGEKKNCLKLTLGMENGGKIQAVSFNPEPFERDIREWFGDKTWEMLLLGAADNVKLDIVYVPTVNEFRGNRSVELKLEDYDLGSPPFAP